MTLRWENGCFADTARNIPKPGRYLIRKTKHKAEWSLQFAGHNFKTDLGRDFPTLLAAQLGAQQHSDAASVPLVTRAERDARFPNDPTSKLANEITLELIRSGHVCDSAYTAVSRSIAIKLLDYRSQRPYSKDMGGKGAKNENIC